MRSKYALLIVLLALLALVPIAVRAQDTSLDAIRRATEPFKQVATARAEGYQPQFGCIVNPATGAMGIHYINGDIFSDPTIDPLRPEAVTYEPQPDGTFQAVGLEYFVLQDAWHKAGNASPPTMLGQEFMPVTGFFDVPPFYALHIWLWRENPSGMFASYNPAVTCPADQTVVPPNVMVHAQMPMTGAGGGINQRLVLIAAVALILAAWMTRRARRAT